MKLKRSTARKTKTGAPRLGTSTKAVKPVPLMPRCSKRGGLVLRALVHRHCEEGATPDPNRRGFLKSCRRVAAGPASAVARRDILQGASPASRMAVGA